MHRLKTRAPRLTPPTRYCHMAHGLSLRVSLWLARRIQKGVRRVKREELQRLECKTLAARFRNVVQEGLNCSPFEAEAVLDVVKEVYGPYLDETPASSPPGKITLMAIAAEKPAGKPSCVPLTLTNRRARSLVFCLVFWRANAPNWPPSSPRGYIFPITSAKRSSRWLTRSDRVRVSGSDGSE